MSLTAASACEPSRGSSMKQHERADAAIGGAAWSTSASGSSQQLCSRTRRSGGGGGT